jgi:hypothetical protein
LPKSLKASIAPKKYAAPNVVISMSIKVVIPKAYYGSVKNQEGIVLESPSRPLYERNLQGNL